MLFTPLTALATNGMNMIGTGAVSAGMGGADERFRRVARP